MAGGVGRFDGGGGSFDGRVGWGGLTGGWAGCRQDEEAELLSLPAGYPRTWHAVTRLMHGTYVSAAPAPHEGLGLAAYVQATSPIRRYPDLCVHYQLKAKLRGDDLPWPEAGPGNGLVKIGIEGPGRGRTLMRNADEYWVSMCPQRGAVKRLERAWRKFDSACCPSSHDRMTYFWFPIYAQQCPDPRVLSTL